MSKFRVYASIEVMGYIEVTANTEYEAFLRVQTELDDDEMDFLKDCRVTYRDCVVQEVEGVRKDNA